MALDILILVVVLVAAFLGFQRGILAQAGSIIAVLAGIVAARIFGPKLSVFFADGDVPGLVEQVSGYGVAFILAYLLVWIVARMARSAFRAVKLGIVDKLAGAVFKIAEWVLILSLVLNFYLIITGGADSLRHPRKPWRAAVVDFAPQVLGYMVDMAQNNVNFPSVNTQSDK